MVMTRSIDALCLIALSLVSSTSFALPRCAKGQELDGNGVCVSADRDGDGIPNGTDRCPSEAEDPNGFQDDDGCPDEPLRARDAAARADLAAYEAAAQARLVNGCFDSADLRIKSAREGFTSFDSAIEAEQRCIDKYPDSTRAIAAHGTLVTLQYERDDKIRARAKQERARRTALADDYLSKARFQYTLGTTFAVIAAANGIAAATFVIAQPLGKDDVANTVVGSICLGFAVIFGVETYLRFDQGSTHAKSAKSIRPLAATPSGFVLRF